MPSGAPEAKMAWKQGILAESSRGTKARTLPKNIAGRANSSPSATMRERSALTASAPTATKAASAAAMAMRTLPPTDLPKAALEALSVSASLSISAIETARHSSSPWSAGLLVMGLSLSGRYPARMRAKPGTSPQGSAICARAPSAKQPAVIASLAGRPRLIEAKCSSMIIPLSAPLRAQAPHTRRTPSRGDRQPGRR